MIEIVIYSYHYSGEYFGVYIVGAMERSFCRAYSIFDPLA